MRSTVLRARFVLGGRIILSLALLSIACGDGGGEVIGAPGDLHAEGVWRSVALSWVAPPGAAVASYKVFRDGVEVAEVTGTSHVDVLSAKRCERHDYRVEARGAGGELLGSAEVRSRLPMKNLVFVIGDGMGPAHERAAGCYLFGTAHGTEGNLLSFEQLPAKGTVTTAAAAGSVTDSAASGTAMATGVKVDNGAVSVAIPGDGGDLYTLLECFKDLGHSTGLVSTSEMTHATPATFGAHASSRDDHPAIASDYFTQTKPNVLFGGVATDGVTAAAAQAAGYEVVTDRAGMQGLAAATTHASGQFGSGHFPFEYDASKASPDPYSVLPHLREMVAKALELLGGGEGGFFLMVEGARIDHAAHGNAIEHTVLETVELHETVKTVLDWAAGREDTLVLVTADHETGGLVVDDCKAKGSFPAVSWTSSYHTGTDVNVYAKGPRSERLARAIDNTAYFEAVAGGD